MYCNKCGASYNEGESFCSACGSKIEIAGSSQPFGGQPPYGTQQYGGQQYTYPQQPMMQQPPRKRSKALLWIIVAAIVVLAIAAVLVFVVLPAGNTNEGLLSGNTTQTKFINDAYQVFRGAFSGMDNGTFKKLVEEPFDMTLDVTAEIDGQPTNITLDAAYDKQTLGIALGAGGLAFKALLLEDTLYAAVPMGETVGIKFKTDAALSTPMSLEDRISKIYKNLSNVGKNNNIADIDTKKLTELFINSIDQGLFKKSATKTTLTLDKNDLVDTLNTFADKLDADKELKQSLEDFYENISGTTADIPSLIKDAASQLKSQSNDVNFEIVWEISYSNGVPVGEEISFDSSSSSFDFLFGYEKNSSGNDISLSLASNGQKTVSGDFSFKKQASGIEYNGSVTTYDDIGQPSKISFLGSEDWSGNNTKGSFELTDMNGQKFNISYDEVLKFGMPKNVADDTRFAIDTQNANITDMSDLGSLFGLGNSFPIGLPSMTESPIPVPTS